MSALALFSVSLQSYSCTGQFWRKKKDQMLHLGHEDRTDCFWFLFQTKGMGKAESQRSNRVAKGRRAMLEEPSLRSERGGDKSSCWLADGESICSTEAAARTSTGWKARGQEVQGVPSEPPYSIGLPTGSGHSSKPKTEAPCQPRRSLLRWGRRGHLYQHHCARVLHRQWTPTHGPGCLPQQSWTYS